MYYLPEGAIIVVSITTTNTQMRAFVAFLAATVTGGARIDAAAVVIGSQRTYVFVIAHA